MIEFLPFAAITVSLYTILNVLNFPNTRNRSREPTSPIDYDTKTAPVVANKTNNTQLNSAALRQATINYGAGISSRLRGRPHTSLFVFFVLFVYGRCFGWFHILSSRRDHLQPFSLCSFWHGKGAYHNS